jgi:hypothetical protein
MMSGAGSHINRVFLVFLLARGQQPMPPGRGEDSGSESVLPVRDEALVSQRCFAEIEDQIRERSAPPWKCEPGSAANHGMVCKVFREAHIEVPERSPRSGAAPGLTRPTEEGAA